MKATLRALALAFAPLTAAAQYAGPAIEVCRGYAEAELRNTGAQVKAVVFEQDRDLHLERQVRKLGSQSVSALLSGNGAIVYPAGPAIEMSFVCMLADERRALFFHWTPRRDASALAQCRRAGGDANPCLDTLLRVAEQDLIELYGKHYSEAREADVKAGNENAVNAFRRRSEAWHAYRDTECAGRAPGDERKACMIELTRRRALDLR